MQPALQNNGPSWLSQSRDWIRMPVGGSIPSSGRTPSSRLDRLYGPQPHVQATEAARPQKTTTLLHLLSMLRLRRALPPYPTRAFTSRYEEQGTLTFNTKERRGSVNTFGAQKCFGIGGVFRKPPVDRLYSRQMVGSIKWKGFGRKRWWPNRGTIRHLPGGTDEVQENPVGTAPVPVEIRTKHFPNINLLRYNYNSAMDKNGENFMSQH